jgi:leader peptidase (prepilin peptidase) / N-methyltransferase
MHALVGSLVGAAAGLAAWWAAGAWSADFPPGQARNRPGWRAACSLVGGMTLWGAYAGWWTGHLGRTALAVAFTGLLLLISLVDLRTQRIPHALVLLLLGLALAQALWLAKPAPALALFGLAVGGGLLFLISLSKSEAFGPGDIRMAAALGAMLGLPDILPALVVGILAGGAGALWLLSTHRAGCRDRMAYAPYLALGAWLVWTRSFGLWP